MGGGVPRREATETVPDSLKATSDCSRKQGMSRGRRDSPSFPGLLQAQPGVHSHECSSSLAKNSCTATNTNIHLHIYAVWCHFFSPHHPDLQTDYTLCFWTQSNWTNLEHSL